MTRRRAGRASARARRSRCVALLSGSRRSPALGRRRRRARRRDRPHARDRRDLHRPAVAPTASTSRSTSPRATHRARRRRASSTSTTRSSPSSPARAASRSRAPRARPVRVAAAIRRTRRCSGSTSGSGCTAARPPMSRSRSTSSTRARRPNRAGPGRPEPRHAPGLGVRLRRREGQPGHGPLPGGLRRRGARTATFDRPRPHDRRRGRAVDASRSASRSTSSPTSSAQREAAYAETPLRVAGRRPRRSTWLIRGWTRRSGLGEPRRRPVHAQPAGAARRDRAAVAARRAAHRPGGGRAAARGGYAGLFDPADEPDRGRLLGRSAGRPPRGGPRLVQRRAARRPLGERGVRVALRAARRRGDQGPRRRARCSRDALKKAAIPLNAWAPPTIDAEGAAPMRAPTETYGYAASLALAAAIAERAGDDALQGRLGGAREARIGAYQPDGRGVRRRRQ